MDFFEIEVFFKKKFVQKNTFLGYIPGLIDNKLIRLILI